VFDLHGAELGFEPPDGVHLVDRVEAPVFDLGATVIAEQPPGFPWLVFEAFFDANLRQHTGAALRIERKYPVAVGPAKSTETDGREERVRVTEDLDQRPWLVSFAVVVTCGVVVAFVPLIADDEDSEARGPGRCQLEIHGDGVDGGEVWQIGRASCRERV